MNRVHLFSLVILPLLSMCAHQEPVETPVQQQASAWDDRGPEARDEDDEVKENYPPCPKLIEKTFWEPIKRLDRTYVGNGAVFTKVRSGKIKMMIIQPKGLGSDHGESRFFVREGCYEDGGYYDVLTTEILKNEDLK